MHEGEDGHPGMKLGRLPSPPEKRAMVFTLEALMPVLPAPPETLDLRDGIASWPMFANDRMGDCTAAALGHMLEVFTEQVDGAPKMLTDTDIIALYNLCNDGVDRGADMLRVLGAYRNVGLAGEKVLAYVDVKVADTVRVKTAAWLFSGLYMGLNLPLTAQAQTGQSPWTVVPDGMPHSAAGSWGGHCVNAVGYDQTGLTVVTWGALQQMTWEFFEAFCDECYVVLPQDYDRLAGKPLLNGFNEDQLRADLAQFGTVG